MTNEKDPDALVADSMAKLFGGLGAATANPLTATGGADHHWQVSHRRNSHTGKWRSSFGDQLEFARAGSRHGCRRPIQLAG